MTFAQPLGFWLLALFLPVVLLYLLKQRRRRVQVSTMMFWEGLLKDEHRVASFTRLRRWLSLLLQLLVIGLLAFAVARPLLSGAGFGARCVVVLIDASASMAVWEGTESRRDRAIAAARDLVAGAGQGDSIMIVAVEAQPNVIAPFTESRREALESLDRVRVVHGPADFQRAFDLLSHLPSDDRPTRVFVVSDGAFSPIAFSPPGGMTFDFIGIGDATANVGITAFALRPLPSSPRDFDVMMEVLNATDAPIRAPYEVRANGTLIDAGELDVPAQETVTKRFRQASDEGGIIEVFVDHKDAFPLDNRAYAVLPEPQRIRVGLVTEGNAFVESALLTDDLVDLDIISPADYQAAQIEKDVLVFDRWAPETAPTGDAIYFGVWPKEWNAPPGEALADPVISDWDREHPINRGIQWASLSLREATKFAAPEGFSPLVRCFDDPLIAIREQGEVQTVAVAFDPAASDFPLRVAFPLFTANVLRYMRNGEGAGDVRTIPAGTVLGAEDLVPYSEDAIVSVRQHDAAPEVALPIDTNGADQFLFPVRDAGVYLGSTSTGTDVPLFAVNVCNSTESRIAPSATLPVTGDALPAMTDGFRAGAEPWTLLAAAAFALLCGEWILFHRRWVE